MAAELEEAVVRAHRGDLEHLGEDARERLLHRAARGDVGALAVGGGVGRGQRAAIDLAVDGDGQGRERDEDRGDEVRGEPLGEVARELGAGGRGALAADDVGHEALVAGVILARDHRAGADGGVLAEGDLDLAELDAEAPDLHLEIRRPPKASAPSGSQRARSPVR